MRFVFCFVFGTFCILLDSARSSRDALQPYLPIYTNTCLYLPAHLPSHIRTVRLPDIFRQESKKKNECILALMACVRLHKINVLNDRLLPLHHDDIQKKLLSTALTPFPRVVPLLSCSRPPTSVQCQQVFIYPLIQSGPEFQQHESALNSTGCLCLVVAQPLLLQDSVLINHNELGEVSCQLGTMQTQSFNCDDWRRCMSFYLVLMNSRWSRRTGSMRFRSSDTIQSRVVPLYVVVCMDQELRIDWNRMAKVIGDFERPTTERRDAVKTWTGEKPRLWAPLYDPNTTYISYEEEIDMNCSSPFPNEDYVSYQDYFLKKRSFMVDSNSPLIRAQRAWDLPQTMTRHSLTDKPRNNQTTEDKCKSGSNGKSVCKGLMSVLLPRDACMEAPLADAALYLHCILLPQLLYMIDRIETAHRFVLHCSKEFPCLGNHLQQISIDKVLEALTAKSCALDTCYDRLEYLGDAVLKLIHTDSLICCENENLRLWLQYLHEGDLSMVRSAMGCNSRLKDAAECGGFVPYILTVPLGRGLWKPYGLDSYNVVEDLSEGLNFKSSCNINQDEQFTPSSKVKADIIEALLGLIYVHTGYENSVVVAEQMGLSLYRGTASSFTYANDSGMSSVLLEKAAEFLGLPSTFHQPGLILEATTHPSKIHSTVPCYQRLEWIGDAVLCMAAREWVFSTYPYFQVKQLSQIETSMVCNETLAYHGHSSEIHRYVFKMTVLHYDNLIPLLFIFSIVCILQIHRTL